MHRLTAVQVTGGTFSPFGSPMLPSYKLDTSAHFYKVGKSVTRTQMLSPIIASYSLLAVSEHLLAWEVPVGLGAISTFWGVSESPAPAAFLAPIRVLAFCVSFP